MTDQQLNNTDKQERDRGLNVARQNDAIRETNKLTVEEIQNIIEIHDSALEAMLAKQLADTMRENERLRKALGYISRMRTLPDHKSNTFTLAIAHKLADDALQQHKEPLVIIDPSIPPGEAHFKDKAGNILGKIVDLPTKTPD